MGDDDLEAPWRPPAMPEEHARMGLTRHTVEGAWIEFAANLDPRRRYHLVVAWVALVVISLPVLFSLLNLMR